MYSDSEYHEKTQRILDRQEFDVAAPRSSERINQDALEVSEIARESVPPLQRLEETIHPWSSFLIVPIFALANAGVSFAGVDLVDAATHPVALGVAIGLLVGKTVGITTFAFAAVRLGWGKLPRLTTWPHIVGVAAVAGIGFTVSLFVTGLAFPEGLLADRAKTGIFLGSTMAGLLGWLILRTTRPTPSGQPTPDDDDRPAVAARDQRANVGSQTDRGEKVDDQVVPDFHVESELEAEQEIDDSHRCGTQETADHGFRYAVTAQDFDLRDDELAQEQ